MKLPLFLMVYVDVSIHFRIWTRIRQKFRILADPEPDPQHWIRGHYFFVSCSLRGQISKSCRYRYFKNCTIADSFEAGSLSVNGLSMSPLGWSTLCQRSIPSCWLPVTFGPSKTSFRMLGQVLFSVYCLDCLSLMQFLRSHKELGRLCCRSRIADGFGYRNCWFDIKKIWRKKTRPRALKKSVHFIQLFKSYKKNFLSNWC
jgi:hypothetical protein